jgi:hypothetical protein
MDGQIVALYCLCDDLVKALRVYEDPQRQMSDAEMMTTAIVATWHFSRQSGTGSDVASVLGLHPPHAQQEPL